MRKKILLPTDFSKNAFNAISYVLSIYKNEPCDFYVLNTYSAPRYLKDSLLVSEPAQDKFAKAKEDSEAGLNETMRLITYKEENNSKHKFTVISQFENLLKAITNIVEDKDIELVVMGSKGATDAKSLVFGSNSLDAMEKVRNCPVLVVPLVAKPQLPKEIVFPTSYKTHFKRRELNFLIEIANISKASIRVLHVSDKDELEVKQEERKALLEEYFTDLEHSFHTLTKIKVNNAVRCFVESRGSDMIAFINRKHAFFGSLITNPLVKDLGHNLKVPLLVMHDLRN